MQPPVASKTVKVAEDTGASMWPATVRNGWRAGLPSDAGVDGYYAIVCPRLLEHGLGEYQSV